MPLNLVPWQDWQNPGAGKNPDWWKDYNNVKHQRDIYFKRANLQNVLSSGAGLLVLLIYWYFDEINKGMLYPQFRVFEVDPKYAGLVGFKTQLTLPDIP